VTSARCRSNQSVASFGQKPVHASTPPGSASPTACGAWTRVPRHSGGAPLVVEHREDDDRLVAGGELLDEPRRRERVDEDERRPGSPA